MWVFKWNRWWEYCVRAWFRRLLERYVIFSASCFVLSQSGGSFCPPPAFVIPLNAEVTLWVKHVCVERFLQTCEPCHFRHGWIIIRSLHYPSSFTVSYEVAPMLNIQNLIQSLRGLAVHSLGVGMTSSMGKKRHLWFLRTQLQYWIKSNIN